MSLNFSFHCASQGIVFCIPCSLSCFAVALTKLQVSTAYAVSSEMCSNPTLSPLVYTPQNCVHLHVGVGRAWNCHCLCIRCRLLGRTSRLLKNTLLGLDYYGSRRLEPERNGVDRDRNPKLLQSKVLSFPNISVDIN